MKEFNQTPHNYSASLLHMYMDEFVVEDFKVYTRDKQNCFAYKQLTFKFTVTVGL